MKFELLNTAPRTSAELFIDIFALLVKISQLEGRAIEHYEKHINFFRILFCSFLMLIKNFKQIFSPTNNGSATRNLLRT